MYLYLRYISKVSSPTLLVPVKLRLPYFFPVPLFQTLRKKYASSDSYESTIVYCAYILVFSKNKINIHTERNQDSFLTVPFLTGFFLLYVWM